MTAVEHLVIGNLALAPACEELASRPRLTVIEGRAGERLQGHMPEHAIDVRRHGNVPAVVAACFVCLLLTVSLAIGWSVITGRAAMADEAFSHVEMEEVAVEAGDSLWTIAERHAVDGMTTRELVDRLKELNGTGSQPLQPGDVLMVPIAS